MNKLTDNFLEDHLHHPYQNWLKKYFEQHLFEIRSCKREKVDFWDISQSRLLVNTVKMQNILACVNNVHEFRGILNKDHVALNIWPTHLSEGNNKRNTSKWMPSTLSLLEPTAHCKIIELLENYWAEAYTLQLVGGSKFWFEASPNTYRSPWRLENTQTIILAGSTSTSAKQDRGRNISATVSA